MSDIRRQTVRDRRQITIPGDICEELGIRVGDTLELEVRDGSLVVTPSKARALDALKAIQQAFAEQGITEEELLEEGRRVRREINRELYGEDFA